MSELIDRIAALPIWKGRPTIEPLVGGLSNINFVAVDGGEKFVVRTGHDYAFHHVFRERELMTARAAFKAGFGPEVLHDESGIVVSRFIDGKVFREADVRANIPRVAALIRRFHDEMPAAVTGTALHLLGVPRHPRLCQHPRSQHQPAAQERLHRSARHQRGTGSGAGPAARDVRPQRPAAGQHHRRRRRLWLIDFEYAGFNTAMFDLAGLASNAGLRRPTVRRICSRLFRPRAQSDSDAWRMAAMQCASLLREAMWSLVSEMYLSAPEPTTTPTPGAISNVSTPRSPPIANFNRN
jgi:thiamine kinase-like enzyme